ncbi:hypothetical protein X777_00123, partial [Ooceraea biroi]
GRNLTARQSNQHSPRTAALPTWSRDSNTTRLSADRALLIRMTDNTTILHEDKNDDSGYTVSQLSPHIPEFEFQECKTEPCISRTNSTEELSTLDEPPSPLHISLPVITIRTPTVVLERCDKIWETLQLIKIQTDPTD